MVVEVVFVVVVCVCVGVVVVVGVEGSSLQASEDTKG